MTRLSLSDVVRSHRALMWAWIVVLIGWIVVLAFWIARLANA